MCEAGIEELERDERRLDELIRNCSLQLRHLTEDQENHDLAYVTYHDIRRINSFKDNTIIAIKAPAETRLEVPDPKEVRHHTPLFNILQNGSSKIT